MQWLLVWSPRSALPRVRDPAYRLLQHAAARKILTLDVPRAFMYIRVVCTSLCVYTI